MKKLRNIRRNLTRSCITFLFLNYSLFLYPEFISNPKPNLTEKNFVKLKKLKEISTEIDNKHFIAEIKSIAIDKVGSIYIYDSLLKKIIKIDKNGKFLFAIGNHGNGPGDISFIRQADRIINIDDENNLLVSDPINRKILFFSESGAFLKEIYFSSDYKKSFFPVIDNLNRIFLPGMHSHLLRVINSKTGNDFKKLIQAKELKKFIIFQPNIQKNTILTPNSLTLYYDRISNNRIIVFLPNSLEINVFNSELKKMHSFYVWPKKIITKLQKYKNTLDDDSTYIIFVNRFFVDKDNMDFFYINFSNPEFDKNRNIAKSYLYRFNLNGELNEVLFVEESRPVTFLWKQNNNFYVRNFERDRLIIYQKRTK